MWCVWVDLVEAVVPALETSGGFAGMYGGNLAVPVVFQFVWERGDGGRELVIAQLISREVGECQCTSMHEGNAEGKSHEGGAVRSHMVQDSVGQCMEEGVWVGERIVAGLQVVGGRCVVAGQGEAREDAGHEYVAGGEGEVLVRVWEVVGHADVQLSVSDMGEGSGEHELPHLVRELQLCCAK